MKIRMKRIDRKEILEFIEFNFDGQGGVLVFNYETQELEYYNFQQTKDILWGENGKEPKYQFINDKTF